MIITRNKIESNFCSIFKGPKTYTPLARGTEKEHFMSVQNYANFI